MPASAGQDARAGGVVRLARELAERRRVLGDARARAHIHSSIAPAAKTPPSSAYSISPSMRQATVGSSPPGGLRHAARRRGRARRRRCRRSPSPGPGTTQPAPGERRLLVDDLAAQRQLDRPARHAAACRARPPCRGSRGSTSIGTPKHLAAGTGRSPGVPSALQLRARRGGGVGGEAGAEPVAEERVDGAHPQRARPRAPAATVVVVLAAARRAWRRRSRGRSGRPLRSLDLVLAVARAVEDLLRALVLPDDDRASAARRVSASQASTDSPWWSSPQATTSPSARRRAARRRRRRPRRASRSPSCSTQPASRVAVDLVAPRLARPAAAARRRARP